MGFETVVHLIERTKYGVVARIEYCFFSVLIASCPPLPQLLQRSQLGPYGQNSLFSPTTPKPLPSVPVRSLQVDSSLRLTVAAPVAAVHIPGLLPELRR